MMNTWIASIWLILIDEVLGPELSCKIIHTKKADCSFKGTGEPPKIQQFLNKLISNPSQIEFLDISRNTPHYADFSKFDHLIHLYATYLEFSDSQDEITFKKSLFALKKLEELDLSGTLFFMGFISQWPPKLTKLKLSNMNAKNITGLEKLHELEELDLSSNELKTLPKLNTSNPITTIYLNKNPIDVITVEQIAPLCQLSGFFLEVAKHGKFTTQSKYYECKLVESWLTKFKISNDPFFCGPSPPKYTPKSYNFSAEAMKARNDCLSRLPSTSVFELLMYAIFFSVLFPVLYFGNEAYNNYQSRKRARTPKLAKYRNAGSEIDFEADQSDIFDSEYDENGV